MNPLGTVFLLMLPALFPPEEKTGTLDRDEAKQAFQYLNRVRADPPTFGKEIGADLKDVEPQPKLAWNDALAKAAEEKALDMATRNYFGHVTPEGVGINRMMHEAGY